MRILSVICSILACFTHTSSLAQIQGPDIVCANECHNYMIDTTLELYWTITGGVVSSNTGSEIEICWEEAQTGQIDVASLDNQLNESLMVVINEEPQPDILFPEYPNCSLQDSTENQEEFIINEFCQTVCGGGNSFFEIANNNNQSTYTWIITGDNNHTITPQGIDIEWPIEGYGSVILIEENSTGCLDSSYTCIKILDEPTLDIELINSQIDLSNLCQNQNIYLSAISNQNLNFNWQSSDGQIYTGQTANFSFDNTGTYEITLTGITDCFCFVTEIIEVTVIDFVSPTIDCIGTTCIGEESTYYAADICGNYNWSVGPNGTITEGGQATDNFISVEWSSGPYGTISLSTSACDDPNICTTPAIELVPIMGSTVTIKGPDEVCNDGTSTFSTQLYEGANYDWNISGNGYILNGNGSNEITVQWDPYSGNISNISVDIENCYLECSTKGEKEIKVEAPFGVSSLPNYCENETAYFFVLSDWNAVDSEWAMVSPDNQVLILSSNDSDLYIDFNQGPGIYEIIVTAISDDYCNKEERTFVEVFEAPSAVAEISGSEYICLDEAYQYSIINPSPQYDYTWEITDGSNTVNYTGIEIYNQWISAGPYTMMVTATDIETSCESDPYSKEFFQISNANLEGEESVCPHSLTKYELNEVESSDIEWTILPSNLGIASAQDDNTANVLWLEAGTATLTATYCGQSYSITVDVSSNLTGYSFNSPLCAGETTDIILDAATSGITVTDAQGNIVGTSAPVTVGPGHYELTTTDFNGCPEYNAIHIAEWPNPAVHISSKGLNRLCMSGGMATLDALSTNGGLSYTWYKDGVNLNINASSILGGEGLYRVEVIDINGCESVDILEVECTESMCSCRPDGGVRYDYARGAYCNQFDFTNTSFDYIAGTLVYDFDDPDSPENITTDENPSHEFTQAGHFVVVLEGIVPHATDPGAVCPAQFVDFITVEAVSDFEYTPACAGEFMEFTENSNFLPDFSITNYEWDFNDPSSGADNISTAANPIHQFSSAGNYNVSLTITTNTGCQSIKTKMVTVHEGPAVDFNIPASLCTNEIILFSSISAATSVSWDFDDDPGRIVNNEEAYHIYDTPGNYDITLTGRNIYNCTNSITKTITIVDNNLGGDIALDKLMPMCEGEEVTLDAPAGGFAYLWNNGATTQTITTGVSGIYSVTVTSNDGCDYIPESVIVNTIRPINPIITGYVYDNFSSASTFFNEMEICEGDYISLGISYIAGASYLWSTGEASNYLSGASVNSLTPGEYIFTNSVTESNFNCTIESDPFKVIVHPRPSSFQIASDQAGECEGPVFTFSVVNPDPALRYYWNNGMEGSSIEVSAPGYYVAEAFNEFGCSRSSNGEFIRALPDISKVLTGCLEVCFPETLCVAETSSSISYTWFLDGVPITGVNGNELVVNEIGDYQVEMQNFYGCTVMSDVISLSPETNEQSLDGIVFMDTNGNGIHDVGETLITGASVNIISGSTVLASTTTDVNGFLFV